MPVDTYNLPAMNKVMETIETDQGSHDQEVYGVARMPREVFEKHVLPDGKYEYGTLVAMSLDQEAKTHCKTAYCFAGHATRDAGYKGEWAVEIVDDIVRIDMDYVIHPTAGRVAVDVAARDILGLSEHEALVMFAASRTRAELRAMVDAANAGVSVLAGLENYRKEKKGSCPICQHFDCHI